MDAKAIVGWNVRRLRVARGITQERLAFASMLDRAYTGRIERGLENLTVNAIEALAVALDVHISELFVEPDSPELHAPLRSGRKAKG